MKVNCRFKLTLLVLIVFFATLSQSVASEKKSAEEIRNEQIQRECADYARNNSTTGGGPQVDPNCEAATSWICLVKKLCANGAYEKDCHRMRQRALASCEIVSGMGYECPSCTGVGVDPGKLDPDSKGITFEGTEDPEMPIDMTKFMENLQKALNGGDMNEFKSSARSIYTALLNDPNTPDEMKPIIQQILTMLNSL